MDITKLTTDCLESTRINHNQLLDLTDKYVLQDYPMDSSNLTIVKDFRNELRNYFSSSHVVGWSGLQIYNTPQISPRHQHF